MLDIGYTELKRLADQEVTVRSDAEDLLAGVLPTLACLQYIVLGFAEGVLDNAYTMKYRLRPVLAIACATLVIVMDLGWPHRP